jgi:hypothetical protein
MYVILFSLCVYARLNKLEERGNEIQRYMQLYTKLIKKLVRTLSIFKFMAFVKDAKGISFKNRFKGHINWRKVRNFNVI